MLLNVKKIWWYLIIFVLLIVFATYFILIPKTVHIYIDYATTPTLLQMIDMVKQNPEEEKIVVWRRMRNLNKELLSKKYNAHEIYLDTDSDEYKSPENLITIVESIHHLIKKNNNTSYVIHANLDHIETLIPLLQLVPISLIEHIHLYEDSIGKTVLMADAKSIERKKLEEAVKQFEGIDKNYYRYNLHKIYPVTYHLAFKHYIENFPTMHNFRMVVPTDLINDVSIHKIAKSLTDVEKQKLSELLDVNIEDFNKENNIAVFALGYLGDIQGNKAQIELLRFIKQSVKEKNYTWFYKEHPWLTNDTYLKNTINKEFPDMKEIRKDIPLEVFIILGGKSFKFAGYSSSIFMSVPPKDIIYYIRRPKDVYLPFLFEQNIVSPKQVINIVDYIREINDVQK